MTSRPRPDSHGVKSAYHSTYEEGFLGRGGEGRLGKKPVKEEGTGEDNDAT